ncbi:3-deoxy-D-manno-octulosonic acid kinase [Marinomonas sp. 2405UD68-3]|uniref:3-deoxy-D-manno-octulosonic acid kinase n=1 Tax=Marinomonas sp. 2405UD68-3 TaxID=3391835 RepID=UPI0039C96CA5
MPQRQVVSKNIELLLSETTLPIISDWFSANYWQSRDELSGIASGRGTVWFIKNTQGEFVLKQYRRGGVISKFIKYRFLFEGFQKSRPFQELSLLESMFNQGLPVPKPIAGKVIKKNGFYEAFLLTETLSNTNELFELARNAIPINWYSVGQTIKRFHQAGVFHSDLNCHNILIDNTKKVWLIDFDKCDQRPPSSDWQESNLQRLLRSLNKEQQKHNDFHFSETHWAQLLEGYHG